MKRINIFLLVAIISAAILAFSCRFGEYSFEVGIVSVVSLVVWWGASLPSAEKKEKTMPSSAYERYYKDM